jgi:DNA mismatch endonuclease (patch repair protein)
MDHLTREERSRLMSRIRRTDTEPELVFRRALFAGGARGYRLHRRLDGCRPDLLFTRARVVVFIDGCFWHGCRRCEIPMPRSNRSYWLPKLARNIARDRTVRRRLRRNGWNVIRIWEHEVSADATACARRVLQILSNQDR